MAGALCVFGADTPGARRAGRGQPLRLLPRADGKPGWVLADEHGVVLTRMSARFNVPVGDILAVRVAAILVRHAREGEAGLHCRQWELVLPEIEYRPAGG